MYSPPRRQYQGLAPQHYVDAMYGSVPGATKNSQGVYTLPCTAKLNISMVFGYEDLYVLEGLGTHDPLLRSTQKLPMHPIDSVSPSAIQNGQVICRGAFSYVGAGTDVGKLER